MFPPFFPFLGIEKKRSEKELTLLNHEGGSDQPLHDNLRVHNGFIREYRKLV